MTSSLFGYNANFIGGEPSPVCAYSTVQAAHQLAEEECSGHENLCTNVQRCMSGFAEYAAASGAEW